MAFTYLRCNADNIQRIFEYEMAKKCKERSVPWLDRALFMHTGTQRKMSARTDGCPAREQAKALRMRSRSRPVNQCH